MIDSQPLHIDLNTKPKSLAEHIPIHNHILLRTGTINSRWSKLLHLSDCVKYCACITLSYPILPGGKRP